MLTEAMEMVIPVITVITMAEAIVAMLTTLMAGKAETMVIHNAFIPIIQIVGEGNAVMVEALTVAVIAVQDAPVAELAVDVQAEVLVVDIPAAAGLAEADTRAAAVVAAVTQVAVTDKL